MNNLIDFIYKLLMLPVVQISTYFLGADSKQVFNGWLIIKPELIINLNTKCSGLMFFLIRQEQ